MNINETIKNEVHLLIAGTTGSGKSVLLNNIITMLINEKDSSFIFIDIKKVELNEYKETRNCIKYADNKEKIMLALHESVDLIERRFKYMQRKRIKMYPGNEIYIVIDELADLLTDKEIYKNSYPDLCRILQIGRAAGVHVIACTQEPTKTFLGRIKSNFTGVIGLRTASVNESRNILNASGLERLPQYGGAVYLKNGYKNPFQFKLVKESWKDSVIKKHKKSLISRLIGA